MKNKTLPLYAQFAFLAITLFLLQITDALAAPSTSNTARNELMGKFNHLGKEKSPYLLQHKDNPVYWYSWGDEAFQAARKEKKPIFLSIGYSTCYWCHVMEKDSFERQDVADMLNENFISIKIDREERPDIDKIYMDAVMGLTGHGGWPMSVFLTADLKPFFGGTFFYRDQFLLLLNRIHQAWIGDQKTILTSAESITEFLKRQDGRNQKSELTQDIFNRTLSDLKQSFDSQYGGFGSAPKFPQSERLSLLLRLADRPGSHTEKLQHQEQDETLQMVTRTLEAMARGGMYDHLGGGFHRYSTDHKWLVPHFEKMLYDNALLSWVYLEAFQVTQNEMFAAVARQTLDYVLREMTSPEGGFFSAQDAGEVGKEGEFFVWTQAELKAVLNPSELEFFGKVYGISQVGNFEHGTNILSLQRGYDWAIKSDSKILSAHQKLLLIRDKREHPRRDDKVLTDWNGLMISAFAKGYQVLRDSRYLDAAKRSADFIQRRLYQQGKLYHRYRDGSTDFPGYLNDYAYLIQGFLDLYEASFDEAYLRFVTLLQKLQDKNFWDEEDGGYFFSSPDDPSVLIRKKDFGDGAEPSGNSVAALNLLKLHDLFVDRNYKTRAEKLFEPLSGHINEFPSAYASALIALDYHLSRSKEIVVVTTSAVSGKEEPFIRYLWSTFLPNKVLAYGIPASLDDVTRLPIFRGRDTVQGKTTAYVCEDNTCKLPTTELEQLKALVKS